MLLIIETTGNLCLARKKISLSDGKKTFCGFALEGNNIYPLLFFLAFVKNSEAINIQLKSSILGKSEIVKIRQVLKLDSAHISFFKQGTMA